MEWCGDQLSTSCTTKARLRTCLNSLVESFQQRPCGTLRCNASKPTRSAQCLLSTSHLLGTLIQPKSSSKDSRSTTATRYISFLSLPTTKTPSTFRGMYYVLDD